MTPEARRRSWVALAVVLSAGFAILAHASIIDGVSPTVGALLSLIPIAVLAAWALRRSRHRAAALAVVAMVAVVIAYEWGALERHFPSLFFVEHAGANLMLAIVFGRTLVAGHEPLVTRFARLLHGTIPPEVERYTRQVTLAWTIFFTTLFVASSTLYFGHFLAAWSTLANILSPILVASMFVVEYAVRHRVLPHWERVGILGGIRAFSRHFGAARYEAPR
ncbi:MAG TPA: hypothetical protein VM073_05655 [Usitatibacter sp.]|nr:hypothetical protein [Usitatibacter sp.]